MDRLEQALELWLRFRAEDKTIPADVFLDQHADLRDLLEPLLADDDAAGDGVETRRILGDYRLLEEIGRGGMGVVYVAWQASLDRHVAVKVLPAHLTQSPRSVARFKRESTTAARLNHPGIVEIFTVASVGDVHYFAMELIDGSPLDKVIARAGRGDVATLSASSLAAALNSLVADRARTDTDPSVVPGTEAPSTRVGSSYANAVVELTIKVADALHHAHEHGVIHRDIKPSNIILRRNGDPVLTDFGLAREEGLPALTVTGEFTGTPNYVSPEQVEEQDDGLDRRTDIFSLGVTLFELLTHRRPFEAETSQGVLQRILTRDPPDPSRLNPRISADLAAVVCKALEKDRNKRYGTAADLAADLRRCLLLQPVSARRLTRTRRVLRWARREPAPAALAFLLVVVVPVLTTALMLTEGAARRRADELAGREQRARVEAERRALEARQVSDFLVDLFENAHPSRTLGDAIPVGLLLQQGAQRIEGELRDQPTVRARLLTTLGNVHIGLAESRKAVDLLRRALQTIQGIDPRDPAAELDLQQLIAGQQVILGETAAAREQIDDVLAKARRELGPDHTLIAQALAVKGTLAANTGDPAQAEALLREAVAMQRRIRPQSHPALAAQLQALAVFLGSVGMHEEAHGLLKECLEVHRRTFAPSHPARISTLAALAANRATMGAHGPAREFVDEALGMARTIFGPDHPRVALALIDSAWVHRCAGQIQDAVTELLRARAIVARYGAFSKQFLAGMLSDLGDVYEMLGRHAAARDHYVDALAAAREASSGDSVLAAILMTNLSTSLVSLGDVAEAESFARQGLAMLRRLDPDSRYLSRALNALAWSLTQGWTAAKLKEARTLVLDSLERAAAWPAEKWTHARSHLMLALLDNLKGAGEAAEAAALRALSMFEEVRVGDDATKALAEYHLGWARLNQKQLDRAAKHFEASIAMYRRISKGGPIANIVWPLSHYGLALFEADRAADALPYLREAYEIRSGSLGAENRWRLNSTSMLGFALLQLERYAEAEPLLIAAYEGFGRSLGKTAPETTDVLRRLVRLYEKSNAPDQAAAYRAQLPAK